MRSGGTNSTTTGGYYYAISDNTIKKRREGLPPAVIETARKADLRLHKKFMRLVIGKGKRSTVAATAVARELAGFVWAIGNC